jgi:hypothetical protein
LMVIPIFWLWAYLLMVILILYYERTCWWLFQSFDYELMVIPRNKPCVLNYISTFY